MLSVKAPITRIKAITEIYPSYKKLKSSNYKFCIMFFNKIYIWPSCLAFQTIQTITNCVAMIPQDMLNKLFLTACLYNSSLYHHQLLLDLSTQALNHQRVQSHPNRLGMLNRNSYDPHSSIPKIPHVT